MPVIITGTSSGIGKAIAERYLAQGQRVIGIGRRHTIEHAAYLPVVCDLSDPEAIRRLPVRDWITEATVLINNAGLLGQVRRISDQDKNDAVEVMTVNTIAPALLMQQTAAACGDLYPLTVVNISSGAAKRAIPSWASYCASKAALELFSETFLLEEREKGRATRVYAVAPGVVDTSMQAQIRTTDPNDFAALSTFVGYHENGELVSPERVAEKLEKLLKMDYSGQVSYSLRDIA